MNSYISTKIEEKYLNLRNKAIYTAEENLNSALSNDEFKSIYYALKDLEKEEAFAEVESDNAKLLKIKAKRTELLKKQSKILNNLALSLEDFKPKYVCKACNDTGFNNGKRCNCYKKYLKSFTLKKLGLLRKNLPHFSDVLPDEGINLKIQQKIKVFTEKFPNVKILNIVFEGNTGTGKTYLAGAVASEIEKKGYSVIFVNAFELNKIFTEYHTTFTEDRLFYMEVITSCDLLVIDDLGTENILKNITCEYLLSTLSERIQNKKHTLITTNLSHNQLMQRYNERFSSRLFDTAINATFKFEGSDKRFNK